MRRYRWLGVVMAAVGLGWVAWPAPAAPEAPLRVAVIGDYGDAGPSLAAVAALVDGWQPDFIITTGDNNYPDGAASTIDANVGQYFHEYIGNYSGSYGPGASPNRFFPSLGNHDWVTAGAQPYLDYFTLPDDSPGGERYYQFTWGPLHLFALDSDPHEPDGITADSAQGRWLQCGLEASTAPWQVVYLHHAPYSSGLHGSTTALQWPYAGWGADVVLAGHNHHYERLLVNGLTYFVVGNSGRSLYEADPHHPQSEKVFDTDYGALLIEATRTALNFKFYQRTGQLVDSMTLNRTAGLSLLPARADLGDQVFLPHFRRPVVASGC
jgi:tartrate-resistant acid phosphatase type 5